MTKSSSAASARGGGKAGKKVDLPRSELDGVDSFCVRARSVWNYRVAPFVIAVLFGLQALAYWGKSGVGQKLDEARVSAFLDENPEGALVFFHKPQDTKSETVFDAFKVAMSKLDRPKLQGRLPLQIRYVEEGPLNMARRFGVIDPPALVWIHRGEKVDELDPQHGTADAITEFVRRVVSTEIGEFDSSAEFNKAIPVLRASVRNKSTGVVIVGFAGFLGTYSCLVSSAHQFGGSATFYYVNGIRDNENGVPLRTISQTAEKDESYSTDLIVEPQRVSRWVRRSISRSRLLEFSMSL